MTACKVYIDGVGLFGPGLNDWQSGKAILAGNAPYSDQTVAPLAGSLLPATERRRAGKSVKLAIEVAQQAASQANIDPALPAMVFASSSGDTEVLSQICETLAGDDRMLSPMRFHNSVHNAAAGYWSIAVGSRQPSTSIALHHLTASAGLLEAAVQAVTEHTPVLLVLYDIPFPNPIYAVEPIATSFACALLLQPQATPTSIASLNVSLQPANQSVSTLVQTELETLRQGVPAARSLPLLQALAQQQNACLILEAVAPQQLHLELTLLERPTS